MKTFFISADRLDSLIEKLWEKASERKDSEKSLSFFIAPKKRQVSIAEDDKQVALINVLDVVDEYDIISELF